jgi:hypothetical protein
MTGRVRLRRWLLRLWVALAYGDDGAHHRRTLRQIHDLPECSHGEHRRIDSPQNPPYRPTNG